MDDFDWIEDIKNSADLKWKVKSSWFAKRKNRRLEKSFREWVSPNGYSVEKVVGSFDISLQSFGYRYVFLWVYLTDGRMIHVGNCFPSPGFNDEYCIHLYSDKAQPIGFHTMPNVKPHTLIESINKWI